MGVLYGWGAVGEWEEGGCVGERMWMCCIIKVLCCTRVTWCIVNTHAVNIRAVNTHAVNIHAVDTYGQHVQ